MWEALVPRSDRGGYIKKLTLSISNGEILPDPYAIHDDLWIVDDKKWPAIVWPDIG